MGDSDDGHYSATITRSPQEPLDVYDSLYKKAPPRALALNK